MLEMIIEQLMLIGGLYFVCFAVFIVGAYVYDYFNRKKRKS